MHNMTAVFSGNRRYFDERVQTDLQQSYEDWQNNMRVDGVRNSANLTTCNIFEWYEWGMLTDYIAYFRVPANEKTKDIFKEKQIYEQNREGRTYVRRRFAYPCGIARFAERSEFEH